MTDTQNSARVSVLVTLVSDQIEREGEMSSFMVRAGLLRDVLARITELEAHIAAEPERMREVRERCAKVAQGWAVHDVAAAIRALEIEP